MKKTKIVATVGPACMDYKILKKMVLAGLNVVRINLSHAKIEDNEIILKNVKKLRKELNVALPILLDTRGPEIRVRTFEEGSVQIKKGQKFIFTGKNIQGNNLAVSLNAPSLSKCVKVGNKILAVNGLLTFKVVDIQGKDIITKAMNSGVLSNRKSLSIPGVKITTPYLNEADKLDIVWAIKNKIEYIAASFVNTKKDVADLKKFIQSNGGDIKIISKIESQLGVENMDEIISSSDGVMVARGDLGVEVDMSKLPAIQKEIIKKCVTNGKPVITATEMLESMITNNRPTRAEVSDIANAVYDGTSCVMLSGETASGNYPVEAVKTMAEVVEETEKYLVSFVDDDVKLKTIADLISHSAVSATKAHNIKAIFAYTDTGLTAGLISRFRPQTHIFGATPNEKVFRQLDLLWGVHPILTPIYNTTDEMFKIANDIVKENKIANVGDKVLITCGTPKKYGGTNLIKIINIE